MTMLSHDDIRRLSPGERLSLIGDLWDSLADADVPLPASQRLELERRLSTIEPDSAEAVTWEQLGTELGHRRR